MQYEILVSSSQWASMGDKNGQYHQGADESLETKVLNHIAEGWRPQGGVSTVVLREDSNTGYTVVQHYQAMVKD